MIGGKSKTYYATALHMGRFQRIPRCRCGSVDMLEAAGIKKSDRLPGVVSKACQCDKGQHKMASAALLLYERVQFGFYLMLVCHVCTVRVSGLQCECVMYAL